MTHNILESLTRFDQCSEEKFSPHVARILHAYQLLSEEQKDFALQRMTLRNVFPDMFSRSVAQGIGKELILSPGDRLEVLTCIDDGMRAFDTLDVENDLHFQNIQSRVHRAFPHDEFTHTFRIKDPESLARNIQAHGLRRGTLDRVGFRIVPKHAESFPRMVQTFEDAFQDVHMQKLNTFAYGDDEIVARISPHSYYYRAVHYYIPTDAYSIEVQLRTPAIDVWSALHHLTVYKPRVEVTDAERAIIEDFGRVSNLVDYAEMLRSDSGVNAPTKIARHNVSAVIMNDRGEVLICKRSMKKRIAPGNWHLPGGKIDEGEVPERAMARELEEELGVFVESVCPTSVKFTFTIGTELHETWYMKTTIRGDISLNYENDAYCYVSPDKLAAYLPADWCDVAMRAIQA